ncbi:hypothetical protein TSOC_000512 [Tetrabaena socialis]|uniref:DM2 domain-containing protein n=1 Tax=Tetrabaena socialis TaxID=47790 RepID=A0A2J8AJ87_9CHLO|nr:hypothetical protein TSOC_000512 [Tetrabaena socialis]|eukprot:PNH12578.1 hypothetical protein TSOC_000512 [Tetrabaena socialis]
MATIKSALVSAASASVSDKKVLVKPDTLDAVKSNTKPKVVKSKSKDAPSVAAPAEAPSVTDSTPVNSEDTAVPPVLLDEVPLTERITTRMAALASLITRIELTVVVELKEMKAELKNLQKDVSKFQKIVATTSSKRSKRVKLNADGTEAPRRISGFQKPTSISDQLADFLNISRGTQLPRNEVTRRINEYIKTNNLQDPADRRKIQPNPDLAALLGTSADTEVSYFNYQGFLKGHFINTGVVAA